MPPAKRRRRDDTLLLDLPDCVLSRVLASLAPAPDLFAVAATCKVGEERERERAR